MVHHDHEAADRIRGVFSLIQNIEILAKKMHDLGFVHGGLRFQTLW